MRALFEVGHNVGGFYVFPYTSPPQCQQAKGDEIGIRQATELCDSLNRNVEDYIAQTGRDDSKKLLHAIAQYWSWTEILSLIRDLIWQECWDRREEGYAQILQKNCLNLGRLIRDWQ